VNIDIYILVHFLQSSLLSDNTGIALSDDLIQEFSVLTETSLPATCVK